MAKKDKLEYVKSSWKGFEICHFRRSAAQNFIHWPTMGADAFEDCEPPSIKFLATPLETTAKLKIVEIRNFQDTFGKRKQSFFSVFFYFCMNNTNIILIYIII